MSTVLYILFAILIFSFLIFIHELGHFITAKLCGIRVNEFSLFMGPKLVQKEKNGTKYSLRCIPIGGYCAMEGEDGESDNPRAFSAAKWWKRLIVLCAGSFMNLLTGFVIITVLVGCTASAMRTATITGFMEGNAISGENGFREGDEIWSVDGKRVYFYSDFTEITKRASGNVFDVTVIRDGQKVKLKDFRMEKKLLTGSDGERDLYYGMEFDGFRELNFFSTLKYGTYYCIDFTRFVWWGLEDLISGRASAGDVGGVVKVVDVMVQSGEEAENAGEGIANVLYLAAFIAVNLAVMNMLPIPALDGGRVLFLLIGTVYTAVTKKKINPKYEAVINGVCMALLLLLMAVIMVKDIVQIAAR